MAVFIHCCHSDMPRDLVPPAVFPRPPGVWDSHLLVTSHPWEPKDPPKGQLDLVQEDCPFPWKWFHNHFWCSKLWPMFEPETVRKMMINLKILWFLQRPQKHPTYWSSLIRHQGSFCRFCATSSRSCHSAFCFFTSSCFCDKKKIANSNWRCFFSVPVERKPSKISINMVLKRTTEWWKRCSDPQQVLMTGSPRLVGQIPESSLGSIIQILNCCTLVKYG